MRRPVADDADAAGDRIGLLLDIHAAGDQLRRGAHGPGEGMDGVHDLHRQLTGGHQDHAERSPPMHLASAEAGGHREGEGQRLAGAGLGSGQHVASGERVRQDRRLDLEGAFEALTGEDAEHLIGQGHVLETLGAVG